MARASKPAAGGQGGKTPAKAMASAAGSKDVEADGPVKTRTSIPQFIAQVRQEVSKVTWPTRKETMVTTIMVFIMVIVASVFFFIADWAIGTAMQLILNSAQ